MDESRIPSSKILHMFIELKNEADRHQADAGQEDEEERPQRDELAIGHSVSGEHFLRRRQSMPDQEDTECHADQGDEDFDPVDDASAALTAGVAYQFEHDRHAKMQPAALRDAEKKKNTTEDAVGYDILLPGEGLAEPVTPDDLDDGKQRGTEQQKGRRMPKVVFLKCPPCRVKSCHVPTHLPKVAIDGGGEPPATVDPHESCVISSVAH